MRFLVSVSILITLLPLHVSSHGTFSQAGRLTVDQITTVLESIDGIDPNEFYSEPTVDSLVTFFEEIVALSDDSNVEIRRVLFMYEAIRTGLLDSSGRPNGWLDPNWRNRIKLDDFQLVIQHYGRLEEWTQRMLEELD